MPSDDIDISACAWLCSQFLFPVAGTAVDVLFIIGPSFLESIYFDFSVFFFLFFQKLFFSQRFVKRPRLTFPIMSFSSILKNRVYDMMVSIFKD